jgi:dephospho-CoA kinase
VREIIAFLGRAGSGKDYQCSLLQQEGYKKLAFADILREMAFHTLGIDYEWGMQHYDELKATELYNGQNFRHILENLGSGIRRYNKDFFVDAVIQKILNDEENTKFCISDLRYTNEAKKLYIAIQDGNLKFIFCNYRSDRYQEVNNHESALLANELCRRGYKDLQELSLLDITDCE